MSSDHGLSSDAATGATGATGHSLGDSAPSGATQTAPGLVRPSSPLGFSFSSSQVSEADKENRGSRTPGRGHRGKAPPAAGVPSSDLMMRTSPSASRRGVSADVGSPLYYPPSSPAALRVRAQQPTRSRTGSDPLFSQSTNGGTSRADMSQLGRSSTGTVPGTPRHRRGDVTSMRQLMNRQVSSTPRGGSSSGPHDATTSDGPATAEGPQEIIWGTVVNLQEVMADFRHFLLHFKQADKIEATAREARRVAAAANAESDENRLDSMADFEMPDITDADRQPFYPALLEQLRAQDRKTMNLDCSNLLAYSHTEKLFHQLIRYPQEVIPLMDHVLTEVYYDQFEEDDSAQGLTVRPFNLQRSSSMRELDPSDMDQLVTIKGLMIRSSPIIPDMKMAFFQCTTCDHTMTVELDRGRITEPTVCQRDACKAKNTIKIIHNRSSFSDKQICRMQETPDETPDGQTPYTVSLCMYDELVDVCKPGDRLEITGIYRGVPIRESSNRRAVKALYKTFIDVVHVKKSDGKRVGIDTNLANTNEFQLNYEESDRIQVDECEDDKILELSQRPNLFELLSRSVAPSIFGMDDVKKGALLQLFGGTNKFQGEKPGNPRIRGDINILLVGDPGVSKSQLLKYVHQIAPRGVYTSGKGSSAVGLTAYITRDPDTRQLVLESGALVLSDGGICCIDEFDKMSDQTRSVLHEVMEQQTISVAKAGIITTLNARTSILASSNPINSKFDEKLSVVENVNLPPPLVSRFDLLFLVLDRPNELADRLLAMHLVGIYKEDKPTVSETEFVPLSLFTKYIKYARTKVQPVISKEAGDKLIEYYMKMRLHGSNSHHAREKIVSATTRQLESMIRLSEAHARMRLSNDVEVSDVDEAYRLIITALQAAATDPTTGRLDMSLLQTGISHRSHTRRSDIRSAFVSMMDQVRAPSIKFMDAYRQFSSQSTERISEDEFYRMVQELADDNAIVMTGRSKVDSVIRKQD